MHGAVQVAGPVVTLVGVLLGVWGTFELTRSYHSLRVWGFLIATIRVAGLFLLGRRPEAVEEMGLMNELTVSKEDRARSLAGIYIIFLGFVAQGLGAVLWGIDMVWTLLERGHPG